MLDGMLAVEAFAIASAFAVITSENILLPFVVVMY
jgi:hypothetical protein